jgi:two-component system cell cycle sensor histidine kinase/response regulator CckA
VAFFRFSRKAGGKGWKIMTTILLVDDDLTVRILAQRVLQHAQYQLLEAADGEEALRLARQYEGEIHLLVADVVMPGGMSGQEVARQLSKDRPNLKVLYISGYTDDEIPYHSLLEPGVNFLPKPFNVGQLTRKVRQVLEQST